VRVTRGRGDVLAPERRQYILRLVEEHGRARVAELAAQFGVSAVTIRKDLAALEADGRLVRAHGGAIAAPAQRAESAFEVRERLNQEAKDAIGRLAASLIGDGESVAFDASTTALAVARHVRQRGHWSQLTVITNGLRLAGELAGVHGITVVMPGGYVRWEALSLVGQLGDGVFQKVNVQKAFLGAAGFTLEAGLSDATEEEAQIKRFMAGAAREVIAIVDSSKWGRVAFATFCRIEGITTVISDEGAPVEMVRALRQRGINVQLVPVVLPTAAHPRRRSNDRAAGGSGA
jgi:DeoR/GlpR family transcriptional regulator of sugar metabolism